MSDKGTAEIPKLTLDELAGLREMGLIADRPILLDGELYEKYLGERMRIWPEQAAAIRAALAKMRDE